MSNYHGSCDHTDPSIPFLQTVPMASRRSGSSVLTKEHGQQQRAMNGAWMICNIHAYVYIYSNDILYGTTITMVYHQAMHPPTMDLKTFDTIVIYFLQLIWTCHL